MLESTQFGKRHWIVNILFADVIFLFYHLQVPLFWYVILAKPFQVKLNTVDVNGSCTIQNNFMWIVMDFKTCKVNISEQC